MTQSHGIDATCWEKGETGEEEEEEEEDVEEDEEEEGWWCW